MSQKENGIMEREEGDRDLAINLSTATTTTTSNHGNDLPHTMSNGSVNGNGDGRDSPGIGQLSPLAKLSPPGGLGSLSKRKGKSGMDGTPGTMVSVSSQQNHHAQQAVQAAVQQAQQQMMLMSQHGMTLHQVQQMQQLLQQQILSPQQLQQMMQQQSLLMQHQQQQQKLQETILHQLNEQLQLNVLQQSQLMQQQQQSDKNKNSKHLQQQLQQLAVQQQQLIQQIQLTQRQYLLSQGMGLVQPFAVPQGMTPSELQALWKEVSQQGGMEEGGLKSPVNGMSMGNQGASSLLHNPNFLSNGVSSDSFLLSGGMMMGQPQIGIKAEEVPNSHPLYGHGVCKWPGCDTPCEDFPTFLKHLNSEHQLDDRNTAQARVQMQVVSQLELQLSKEKERLQAMMQHLHMKPQSEKSDTIRILPKQQQQQHQQQHSPQQASTGIASLLPTSPPSAVSLVSTPLMMTPSSQPSTPQTHLNPASLQSPSAAGPIRRRVSDKCNLPISAGEILEIQRNREFYKNTDVRPPFTYASLIRQAIIESPHKQLTLNEIYQWFQNTFAYFRRNEATWKNAIRTNLSLHKCFVRYEDDFGSFWMVDDLEFVRRRHLTRGRPRKYHENEAPQNISMKSPSLSQEPSLYGDTINASLRAALSDANLPLINNSHFETTNLDTAEDLSMKGHPSPQGETNLSESQNSPEMAREEEIMLSVKQEGESAGLDGVEPLEEEEEEFTNGEESEVPMDMSKPSSVGADLTNEERLSAESSQSETVAHSTEI
ncbi:forkhead box protein P1-like isoform X3 [Liolophura sinensis]|uniref:forkhead box protein P1-like isoform X3 n=1 Tax=Liolophura sinensis TaxID=3198878 RepID=UPI0031587FB7